MEILIAFIIVLLALIFIRVNFLIKTVLKLIGEEVKPQGKNGCNHKSNPRLKITSFGDKGNRYICELCGETVDEKELN